MRQDYIEVLMLDNLLQVLTVWERMQVHQYHTGRRFSVPRKVLLLMDWIRRKKWEAPLFRYNPDRELTWCEQGSYQWRKIEEYELNEELKILKKNIQW